MVGRLYRLVEYGHLVENITTNLVSVVIVTSVKMLFQRSNEARVPTSLSDKTRNIMDDVERVRPLVAFGPARIFPRP